MTFGLFGSYTIRGEEPPAWILGRKLVEVSLHMADTPCNAVAVSQQPTH